MAIDFEQEYSNFTSTDSSAIKDIYEIIPAMTNAQLKVVNALDYFISKYELTDLQSVITKYLKMSEKNKNLSFIKSMNVKNLLKAYTQESLIQGIRISAKSSNDSGGTAS